MKNVNTKKTKEEFISECIITHGNKYIYDNVYYISNKINVEIICPKHGSFFQTPKSHLNGSNCIKCSALFKRYHNKVSEQEFLYKSKLKHGNKYIYDKVNFINMHTNIIIICPTHGEYESIPSHHIKYGCRKCYYDIIGNSLRKNVNMFILQSSKKHNNYYDYSLVEYKSTHIKVLIICPKHGNFYQNPSNHLTGQGCPTCKISKGESSVESFLIENNIKYNCQYRFVDCRNKNTLPFDFYLPDYNICIEYDGKQHFCTNDRRSMFYKKDSIINDTIKNEYCKINKIELIRIHYKDYKNVEKILFDRMKAYKKITQEEKNNKFISKAISVFGYKYDYSKVNYVDSNTRLTIIYNGKEYKQTPIKHLQGKKVENTIRKISTNEFISKSRSIWGNNRFNYSKCEYLGINSNIILFDNLKNKYITQIAKSHLNGHEVTKYDKEDFIQMCNLIYDYKYNYDNIQYKSLISRIAINCPQHGDFELKSSSHLLGYSCCPNCKDFIGEKEISKFLDRYKILYNRQHKFTDCKNKYPLPFDFYISSMRTAIEFDGKQHFQPLEYFGGDQAHEKLKINDKIKSDYCEENYIDLIRIRYDQIDDIDKILWDNLKNRIRK